MIPHRRGRIINIGSLTSVMGSAGLGPYGASRGGIRQLTMSLAGRLGAARHHRELSGAGLVQNRAEQSDVRGS
jgi:NAD(P)-dependent dehydrogenase (short-subunit alcohol dehydrogenase family)